MIYISVAIRRDKRKYAWGRALPVQMEQQFTRDGKCLNLNYGFDGVHVA